MPRSWSCRVRLRTIIMRISGRISAGLSWSNHDLALFIPLGVRNVRYSQIWW
jgi:hypothetical protein